MKKAANLILMVALVLAICVAGCKKDTGSSDTPTPAPGGDKTPEVPVSGLDSKPAIGVDIEKPIAEIKAMVEKMDVEQIKATAIKYKDAILAKKPELDELTDKIKEIPIAKMLSDETKALKVELDELTKSTGALKERFNIYMDKLKELKIDISDIKL